MRCAEKHAAGKFVSIQMNFSALLCDVTMTCAACRPQENKEILPWHEGQ
jgi:hypothetical protein